MSYVQKLYLGPAEVTNSDFNLGNTSTIISRDPINSSDVTNKKYVDEQNTIIYNLLNGIPDTISDLSLNKQNVIDTNNKLPITNVDLTGSALSFIKAHGHHGSVTLSDNDVKNINSDLSKKGGFHSQDLIPHSGTHPLSTLPPSVLAGLATHYRAATQGKTGKTFRSGNSNSLTGC